MEWYLTYPHSLTNTSYPPSPPQKKKKSTSIVFLCITNFWQVTSEFEEEWTLGKVEGWENNGQENGSAPENYTVIDLDYYSTAEELMVVGPEKLKEVW